MKDKDKDLDTLFEKMRSALPAPSILKVESGLEQRVMERLRGDGYDWWPRMTWIFGGTTAACAAWSVTMMAGFTERLATQAWNWMPIW